MSEGSGHQSALGDMGFKTAAYHSEHQQEEDDERRTRELKTMGFEVIRFTNEEVLYDTNKVIEDIIQKLQEYE